MLKAYKFRAEPTKEQLAVLIRTFGCVRYVWNYMLSLRRQEYFLEGMAKENQRQFSWFFARQDTEQDNMQDGFRRA